MTDDEFATSVRNLPLTWSQLGALAEVYAAPSGDRPGELIRREVLTTYQARLIGEGRVTELVVGRYVILAELGAGGMGQVYKARDTAMDRVIALKLLRAEQLGSPKAVLRFQQEVRAAGRLSHQNIVRAYDAGTDAGRHYLVAELVVGEDLACELARRGIIPLDEACEYARQAALGLQHAHENGLTHRDIKPSNLLWSTVERQVKITDFGLARIANAVADGGDGTTPVERPSLTGDGVVFGTPDYIAPEQASSAAKADIRSDLYSLGCTLYHLLSGRVPYPRETIEAKIAAHTNEAPKPLGALIPWIDPTVALVVGKLMSKDPAERYQTPLEVAGVLRPFCPRPRDAAEAPKVDVPPEPPALPSPPVDAAPPPPVGGERPRRRPRVVVSCTVALALLFGTIALGAVGWFQIVRPTSISRGLPPDGVQEDRRTERWAAVTIESFGVRLVVLDCQRTAGEPKLTVVHATNRDWNLGFLPAEPTGRPAAFDELERVLDGLKSDLDSRGVPAERRLVACGSGVVPAGGPNREKLKGWVQEAVARSLRADVEAVSPDAEAEYAARGSIPPDPATRSQSALLDMGAARTRYGYFGTGSRYEGGSFEIGVRTAETDIAALAKNKRIAFASAAADWRATANDLVGSHIGRAPELRNRSRYYLLGGAPWAVAVLSHPKEFAKPADERPVSIPLKPADVAVAHRLVEESPNTEALHAAVLSSVAPDRDRTLLEAELAQISKAFAPQRLLAGAALLRSFSDVCEFQNKEARFITRGLHAWPIGYILVRGRFE